jgi:hypothetical protein
VVGFASAADGKNEFIPFLIREIRGSTSFFVLSAPAEVE